MITLHNNYIFLPKQKKEAKPKISKSTDECIIKLEIGKSVGRHIISIFGVPINSDKNGDPFKIIYAYNITLCNICYNVIFTLLTVTKYTYLDISLDAETCEQAVQVLEYIQDKLNHSKIQDDYIKIISYDSISEYYCNKAYPELNRLERNLRKLLLNTYTVNFGTEYYETTIELELQNKIKKVIQVKGNEDKKKSERLKMFFYSMEFSDIQKLLFTRKWTKFEEDRRKEFLLNNEKLTELTEEELRTAFEKFSPKSDWERLFADKANSDDIENLIESVRKSRNDIAHCKIFYKEQYQTFSEAANELNHTLEEAIRITEEEDFVEKNAENLRVALRRVADFFAQFQKNIQKTIETEIESVKEPNNTGEDE